MDYTKMKLFTMYLLLGFLGFAAAQGGYNYQPPAPVASSVVNQLPRAPIYSPLQAPPLPSYNAPAASYSGGHQSVGVASASISQAPAYQGQSFGQQSGYQQSHFLQQYAQPQRQQIITKDIYIHSAPEEQEESILGDDIASNAPIRKNYRIVFIKAPTQNLKLASNALRQAQSANEEKTVIYVLSKKPDLSEVSAQLQQVQNEQKISKPEVYFIKYKTHEEAARAQQEIQAQYDALGGSTHVSDEGIAPITTVGSLHGEGHSGVAIPIGQYARQAQQSYSQQGVGSSSISAPSAGYLPVKAKK